MRPRILSVIQNWRRPANVARILDAIRSQTIPSTLALVECGEPSYQVPPDVAQKADLVLRVERQNLGPCCRLLPSLLMPDHEFTFWWLDDFLPGPECLASYLPFCDALRAHEWATLGQDGRRFGAEREIVRRRTRAAHDRPSPVDVVVSAELCLTRLVPHAFEFWHRAAHACPDLSGFEDDLILCMGVRGAIGKPSGVFCPANEQESYRLHRLPSPDPLCGRADHDERRARFIRAAWPIMEAMQRERPSAQHPGESRDSGGSPLDHAG